MTELAQRLLQAEIDWVEQGRALQGLFDEVDSGDLAAGVHSRALTLAHDLHRLATRFIRLVDEMDDVANKAPRLISVPDSAAVPERTHRFLGTLGGALDEPAEVQLEIGSDEPPPGPTAGS